MLQERYRPKDVAVQQDKVTAANALAFVAPMYFVGFPAILKGWIERVLPDGAPVARGSSDRLAAAFATTARVTSGSN
jgi:putative NADPH-quinone reductase